MDHGYWGIKAHILHIFSLFLCIFLLCTSSASMNTSITTDISTPGEDPWVNGNPKNWEEFIFSGSTYLNNAKATYEKATITFNASVYHPWYYQDKTSGDVMPVRFPIIVENYLDETQENVLVLVSGHLLKESTSGIDISEIDITKLYVVDPIQTPSSPAQNGDIINSEFIDVDGDGIFDLEDYVTFTLDSIPGNGKKLVYLYDPPMTWEDTRFQDSYLTWGSESVVVEDSKGNIHLIMVENPSDNSGGWYNCRINHYIYDNATDNWNGPTMIPSSSSYCRTYWSPLRPVPLRGVIDSQDNIYIVWPYHNNYYYYTHYNEVDGWASLSSFNNNGRTYTISPAITVDSNDNVHMLLPYYNSHLGGNWYRYRVHHLYSENQGDSYSDNQLPSSGSGPYSPTTYYYDMYGDMKLEADTEGNVYAAWNSLYPSSTYNFDVFYKWDGSSKSWTNMKNLHSAANLGWNAYCVPIEIVIDSNGGIHVLHFYNQNDNSGKWYNGKLVDSYSTDGGVSFTDTTIIDNVGWYWSYCISVDIEAAADRRGNIYGAIADPQGRYNYAFKWEDGTYTYEQLTDIRSHYGATVEAVVDNSNIPHIFVSEHYNSPSGSWRQYYINHYSYEDGSWTKKRFQDSFTSSYGAGGSYQMQSQYDLHASRFSPNIFAVALDLYNTDHYFLKGSLTSPNLAFKLTLGKVGLPRAKIIVSSTSSGDVVCSGMTDNTGRFSCYVDTDIADQVAINATWNNYKSSFGNLNIPYTNKELVLNFDKYTYNVYTREDYLDETYTVLSDSGGIFFFNSFFDADQTIPLSVSLENDGESIQCNIAIDEESGQKKFYCNNTSTWETDLDAGKSCVHHIQCKSELCKEDINGKYWCATEGKCIHESTEYDTGDVLISIDKYCKNGEWYDLKSINETCEQNYQCYPGNKEYCVYDSKDGVSTSTCCESLCVYDGNCYTRKGQVEDEEKNTFYYCVDVPLAVKPYWQEKIQKGQICTSGKDYMCVGNRCLETKNNQWYCCGAPNCIDYDLQSCLPEGTKQDERYCANGEWHFFTDTCTQLGSGTECAEGTCVADLNETITEYFCCTTNCVHKGTCYTESGIAKEGKYCDGLDWVDQLADKQECELDIQCISGQCLKDFDSNLRCTPENKCLKGDDSFVNQTQFSGKYCINSNWLDCLSNSDCTSRGDEYWCKISENKCYAPECNNNHCDMSISECKSDCSDCTIDQCKGDGYCNTLIGENCAKSPNDCACPQNNMTCGLDENGQLKYGKRIENLNAQGCFAYQCGDGRCDYEFGECDFSCEDCSLEDCAEDSDCNPAAGENCQNTASQCVCLEGWTCSPDDEYATPNGCYNPSCGNGVCDIEKNECDEGCSDCSLKDCNADGKCTYSNETYIENCNNSPSDCACNEGYLCVADVTRENNFICYLPVCGDSICQNSESCLSCERDCGSCFTITPEHITGTVKQEEMFSSSISIAYVGSTNISLEFTSTITEITFDTTSIQIGENEVKSVTVNINVSKAFTDPIVQGNVIVKRTDNATVIVKQITVEIQVERILATPQPTVAITLTPSPTEVLPTIAVTQEPILPTATIAAPTLTPAITATPVPLPTEVVTEEPPILTPTPTTTPTSFATPVGKPTKSVSAVPRPTQKKATVLPKPTMMRPGSTPSNNDEDISRNIAQQRIDRAITLLGNVTNEAQRAEIQAKIQQAEQSFHDDDYLAALSLANEAIDNMRTENSSDWLTKIAIGIILFVAMVVTGGVIALYSQQKNRSKKLSDSMQKASTYSNTGQQSQYYQSGAKAVSYNYGYQRYK